MPVSDYEVNIDLLRLSALLSCLESNVRFGNITVKPVADLPVAKSISVELNEDTPTVINFDVDDPDTLYSNLVVIILSIPPLNKGELFEVDDMLNLESKISSAPYNVSNFRKRVLYVPPSHTHGFYFTRFTYRVADESQNSRTNATVTLSINPVNDVPNAINKSYVILEDSELTVTFECIDPDLDPLAIQIESIPPRVAGSLYQTDERNQALYVPKY